MFIAGFKFFFGIIAAVIVFYLAIFSYAIVATIIEELWNDIKKGIKDEIDKIHTDKK